MGLILLLLVQLTLESPKKARKRSRKQQQRNQVSQVVQSGLHRPRRVQNDQPRSTGRGRRAPKPDPYPRKRSPAHFTFNNLTGRLFRERVWLWGKLYLHGRGLRWRLLWWLLRNRLEIKRSLCSRHICKCGYFRFWGTKSWRPIARVSWRSVLLRSLL